MDMAAPTSTRNNDVKRLSITSFIAAVLLATIALVALAQVPVGPPVVRAPYWPDLAGPAKFTEWYSDVPWHQKLGTYAANEIVTPMIFPYEVLPSEAITYCNGLGMTQEDCMIETGVANILG